MIVKNLSQANTDLILGYIKKSLNQSEIIDDINLQTTSCFSSIKIDNLLENLENKLKDYSDNLFNSLTALTVAIASEKPTLDNSQKNIIYLYLTDTTNNVYDQYLKISDTELISLGSTSVDLTDYYTKEESDNTFATKTQVKTLEDDSHKHLNKDILDKLSINEEDKLLYNGNKIGNDTVATKDTLGIVKIGNGLKVDSGVVNFDGSNYYTKTQIDDNFTEQTDFDKLKTKVDNLSLTKGTSIEVLSNEDYENLKSSSGIIDDTIYIVNENVSIYDYISSLGYGNYNGLEFFFNNSTILTDEENLNLILTKYNNDICNNKVFMDNCLSDETLATKLINNNTFMTSICNSPIARKSLYDNYNVTTNILANSSSAINIMKNSSNFKNIVPTTNGGISSNLTTDDTIIYSGNAFVLDVYTSSINYYYTHWHGSYLTGEKNRYYVGLTHGETNKIIINEFASDVRSGTDKNGNFGCADIFMI